MNIAKVISIELIISVIQIQPFLTHCYIFAQLGIMTFIFLIFSTGCTTPENIDLTALVIKASYHLQMCTNYDI